MHIAAKSTIFVNNNRKTKIFDHETYLMRETDSNTLCIFRAKSTSNRNKKNQNLNEALAY